MNTQLMSERSASKRGEAAIVRAALSRGHVTIAHVFSDVPRCINDKPAWEVIGWARWVGQRRVADLNREAIAEEINIARPLRELTRRQLDWLAMNVLPTGSS